MVSVCWAAEQGRRALLHGWLWRSHQAGAGAAVRGRAGDAQVLWSGMHAPACLAPRSRGFQAVWMAPAPALSARCRRSSNRQCAHSIGSLHSFQGSTSRASHTMRCLRRELLRLPDEPKARQEQGGEQQQQGRKERKQKGKAAAAAAAADAGVLCGRCHPVLVRMRHPQRPWHPDARQKEQPRAGKGLCCTLFVGQALPDWAVCASRAAQTPGSRRGRPGRTWHKRSATQMRLRRRRRTLMTARPRSRRCWEPVLHRHSNNCSS